MIIGQSERLFKAASSLCVCRTSLKLASFCKHPWHSIGFYVWWAASPGAESVTWNILNEPFFCHVVSYVPTPEHSCTGYFLILVTRYPTKSHLKVKCLFWLRVWEGYNFPVGQAQWWQTCNLRDLGGWNKVTNIKPAKATKGVQGQQGQLRKSLSPKAKKTWSITKWQSI